MLDERWVPAAGYYGLYEVSSLGRVKSLPKNGASGSILCLDATNTVYLYKNNTSRGVNLPKLIIQSFFDIADDVDLNITHLDGNSHNNELSNLSYSISLLQLSGEEWRSIEGFSRYQISTLGRIRNVNFHIMKDSVRGDGYNWILLVGDDGKQKNFSTHRLVATAFIPNPENKPQVNHIDGNKQNNRVDNLEWVTGSENVRHAYANNLIKDKSAEGTANIVAAAKKTLKRVCNIPVICTTTNEEFESIHHAALHYSVDDTTIQALLRHQVKNSKKLKGLQFEFKDPDVTHRSPHRKQT